jgi:hypothetical protein
MHGTDNTQNSYPKHTRIRESGTLHSKEIGTTTPSRAQVPPTLPPSPVSPLPARPASSARPARSDCSPARCAFKPAAALTPTTLSAPVRNAAPHQPSPLACLLASARRRALHATLTHWRLPHPPARPPRPPRPARWGGHCRRLMQRGARRPHPPSTLSHSRHHSSWYISFVVH